MLKKKIDDEQLHFVQNGCIAPCPYRTQCNTYTIGCHGGCYWCHRFDEKKPLPSIAENDVK